MARKYTNVKELEGIIFEMRAAGKTRREIAENLGLEIKQIKWFISRHNRQERKRQAGIMPRPKGRPRKDATSPDVEREKDYEIQRLKMENELLRDFLRAAGRK